ncbi:hypothetical protein DPMN_104851 [Dreissena polymorpha]|uniref:Uncharacterized protein n=1 Tax=Dreissena polymorpha TaxID=45954 RepID=A0A9D4HDU3_DREPO|nr:hypothetical protein DPMN_104851 [Dreissena polymorpha]
MSKCPALKKKSERGDLVNRLLLDEMIKRFFLVFARLAALMASPVGNSFRPELMTLTEPTVKTPCLLVRLPLQPLPPLPYLV